MYHIHDLRQINEIQDNIKPDSALITRYLHLAL